MALPFLPLTGGIYKSEIPLGIFLILWCHDTGAYLAGKKWGKHSLFLRVSPKKTWEGSIGGALAAISSGYVIPKYCPLLSALQWEIVALIVILFGTYGDLIKSMLKRSLKIKDSGTILPGHGGMLDRFDSLLGAAPFIGVYLILLWL